MPCKTTVNWLRPWNGSGLFLFKPLPYQRGKPTKLTNRLETMARDKVVLWLQDDGTFTDQFETEHDCTIVRQQVVAELADTDSYEGGYEQTVKVYYYEDPLGRRFKFVNRGISYTGPGRTYRCLDGEEYEGTWKRPKKLDRNAPYLTPDGEHEVEIIDEDHDPGYEFYEATQISATLGL